MVASKEETLPSCLFGTLKILQAACINNSACIDIVITPFMHVLNKIHKEHMRPRCPETSPSKDHF